jgi:single-stranded DNA-specific DHH superfamily exonuclease
VPDKDADGLSAGVIVYRTLVKLGLDARNISVHLVQKGSNIHEPFERKSMQKRNPKFVIVLDQGSRGGPPVIDDPHAKCIIIDHHLSEEFPKDATVSPQVPEITVTKTPRLFQHVITDQLQLLPS